MFQEVSTITDLHNESDQAEVELVSLVQDQIPKYTLRADSVHGYSQEDWLQYPVLPPNFNVDLSPRQCEEVFKLFLLSGFRHSQMTETYHDIRAVTDLLEERERDLELAARIGQSLLVRNKAIMEHKESLEIQLADAMEEASQLRHEISCKENLLHIYTNDESASPSPTKEMRAGRLAPSAHVDVLHEKIRQLEEDNALLKEEQQNLLDEADHLDEKENLLIVNTVGQLGNLHDELRSANEQISSITEELTKRTDEASRQQVEIDYLVSHIHQLQQRYNNLTSEHEELQQDLTSANMSQKELCEAVFSLETKYKDVLHILDETRRESHSLTMHSNSMLSDDGIEMSYDAKIPFHHSLAAELEESVLDVPLPAPAVGGSGDPCTSGTSTNTPKRIDKLTLETVKRANKSPALSGTPMTSSVDKRARPKLLRDFAAPQTLANFGKSVFPMGKPGIPGTNDLEEALRQLNLRRLQSKCLQANLKEMQKQDQKASAMRKCQSAPRLRIVKPIEGSNTLQQWKALAENRLPLFNVGKESHSPAGVVFRKYGKQVGKESPLLLSPESSEEATDDSSNDYGIVFSAPESKSTTMSSPTTTRSKIALEQLTNLQEDGNDFVDKSSTTTPFKKSTSLVKFSSTPIPTSSRNPSNSGHSVVSSLPSDWNYLHGTSTPLPASVSGAQSGVETPSSSSHPDLVENAVPFSLAESNLFAGTSGAANVPKSFSGDF